MVKLLAKTLAKHNIKQNADINTIHNKERCKHNEDIRTEPVRVSRTIREHRHDIRNNRRHGRHRMMTYREWLADTIDIDEEDVNKLEHYDKDSLEQYRLYAQRETQRDVARLMSQYNREYSK